MDSSKHVLLCTAQCNVSHSNILLALFNSPDSQKLGDLAPLRRAIDTNLKKGWDLHSDVPDILPEFQFPLVHWACVLGKPKILQWLLNELSFEAGVTKNGTGETGLHRAVACFYNLKKKTKENIPVRVSRFERVVTVLTDQDPNVLFKRENNGNTALHYCADYAISTGVRDKERAFFQHCFTFLLELVSLLETERKLGENSLRDILGAKNSDGETVLHILARNDTGSKVVKEILHDYKDSISASVKNNKGLAPADVAVHFKAHLITRQFKAFSRHSAKEPLDSETLSQETKNVHDETQGDYETAASLGSGEDSSEETSLPCGRWINLRASVQFDRAAIGLMHQNGTCQQSDECEGGFYEQPPDSRASPVRFVPLTSESLHGGMYLPVPSDDVSRTNPAVTKDVTQSFLANGIDTSRPFTFHGEAERSFNDGEVLEDNKCNICCVEVATCSADVPTEVHAQPASFPDSSSPVNRKGEAWDVSGSLTSQEDADLVRPTSSNLSTDQSPNVASLLEKKLKQIRAVAEELRGELGDTESRERVADCELRLLEGDLREVETERETHEQKKRELLEEMNRKAEEIAERKEQIQKNIEEKERAVEDLKSQKGTLTEECERLKRKCNSYMEVLDDCTASEDSPPRKKFTLCGVSDSSIRLQTF